MELLRDIRIQKRQSIQEAAAEVGVSDVAFGFWERGERKISDKNKLKLIRWSKGLLALQHFYDLPAVNGLAAGRGADDGKRPRALAGEHGNVIPGQLEFFAGASS
jgi:hypothetical protein